MHFLFGLRAEEGRFVELLSMTFFITCTVYV